MALLRERLADGWTWWRIADLSWRDPLDPSFAAERGGRWNPPGSFPTLYLNEDLVTARLNLRAFIAQWPYEPEDLRSDTGPLLVAASLPRAQDVCDAHSREGVKAAGLPQTYPLDSKGALVARERCQPIGLEAKHADLRGVRARSARAPDGAGRELAWFPATARSRAKHAKTLLFDAWYWS
jgi:RES domain